MLTQRRSLSHKWQLLLAFFLGGAISSIAQDPSDTLFFLASSQGPLSPTQQSIYWYWVPFAIYIGLFALGYLLAKSGRVKPVFLLYLYLVLVLLSTAVSFTLPQNSNSIYVASVVLGTFVSLGIIIGLRRHVR